jgi:membrane associated rhomboid family serine protease
MFLPIKVETEIEKFPLFTYLIIGVNVIVFLAIHFLPLELREMAYYDYGFIAEQINPLSLISHTFLHVGWLNIIFNMYYLYLFGRASEHRIGSLSLILLYFTSAIAGSLVQGALTPEYLTDIPVIGASGAVSGVLGAYMVLYPWEKVSCVYVKSLGFITTLSISSLWVLGGWLVLQFVNALWFSSGAGENYVAYWAHIGGFAFGAACAAMIKYFVALVAMLQRRSVTLQLEQCSDMIHDGKAAEAEAKLNAALEKESGDPLLFGELGRVKLAGGDKSAARKMFRRSLKKAIKQKNAAAAVSAYFGLVAAKTKPLDNSMRLIIGRRFARLKKYGHALGIMGEPFGLEGEMEGLDKLLYEIGDLFAGPLKDPLRASAAFSLLMQIFPHSPRALDVKYRLRRLRAVGRE